MNIRSMAYVDDYQITIVKRVIRVVIMGNYGCEHDFMCGCIHRCIGEEASSYDLKTLAISNNPKLCIFMNTQMYIC